jgi:DNA helicase HerA-like ATPase
MIDWKARRACTLLAGQSGSGKTTFALRYLVRARDLVARFIFDPQDAQYQSRLGLPAAESVGECEASLADGWTVFDPNALFPGRHSDAFAWFCAWAFEAAARGPGRKVLLVDEVWRYCSPNAIPPALATVIQTGRVRGLDVMFATQRPNRLNEAITNEVSELVCFRTQGFNALRVLTDLGAPQEVDSLPPGQFVALNCQTGGQLRGRVF